MEFGDHSLLRRLLSGANATCLQRVLLDVTPALRIPRKRKAQYIDEIIGEARNRERHARVTTAALQMFSLPFIKRVMAGAHVDAPRLKADVYQVFIDSDAPSAVIAPASPAMQVPGDGILVPADDMHRVRRCLGKQWRKAAVRWQRRKTASAQIIRSLKDLVADCNLTLRGLREKVESRTGLCLQRGASYEFFQKHALRLLRNLASATKKRRRRRVPQRRPVFPSVAALAQGDPMQEFLETRSMYREDNMSYALRRR